MKYEITAVDICGFKWKVQIMKLIDGNWRCVGWETLFHTLAEVGAYINERYAAEEVAK